MALTRDFKDTVARRAAEDIEFRQELLLGAADELLHGDLEIAKTLLRDYINASPRFSGVSKKMKKDPKSIQRMLGPSGNPTAENLNLLLKVLQEHEGITLEVRARTK